MNRTDADVLAWLNALPDETRKKLFRSLGLKGGGHSDQTARDQERLALARALMQAESPNRPN